MALQPVLFQIPQQIAELPALSAWVDIITDSSLDLTVTPTRYPRETLESAVDHAVLEPLKMSLTGFVSDVVTRSGKASSVFRVQEAWRSIEDLAKQREPISVVTAHATYTNMLITSVSSRIEPDTGLAINFTMSLEQVRIATGERVTVPVRGYPDGRDDPADEGSKDPVRDTPIPLPTPQSVLVPLANVASGGTFSITLAAQTVFITYRYKELSGVWEMDLTEVGASEPHFANERLLYGIKIPVTPNINFQGHFEVQSETRTDPGAPTPGLPGPWGATHNLLYVPQTSG